VDQPPTPVFNPAPHYPAAALAARQTGRVVIRVVVDVDGWVTAASLHRSCGIAALDDSALAAVRQWRFRPAQKDGQPVAHEFAVPVHFVLADR
jgi:protein TonB